MCSYSSIAFHRAVASSTSLEYVLISCQGTKTVKVYSSLPEMRDSEVLLVLKRMVNEKLLPSPIEMVFNVFWFVTFAGSVSSAISALIAQRSIKRPIRKN